MSAIGSEIQTHGNSAPGASRTSARRHLVAESRPGAVYRRALGKMLPMLRRRFEPMPWSCDSIDNWLSERREPERLDEVLNASLALALACEAGVCETDAHTDSCISSSLVAWQLSLNVAGRPIGRGWRQDRLLISRFRTVLRILTESSKHAFSDFHKDLAAHLQWLDRHPSSRALVEVQRQCVLVQGALLTRNKSLLLAKRRSLGRALQWWERTRQRPRYAGHAQGSTLDDLSMIQHALQWQELEKPIEWLLGCFPLPGRSQAGDEQRRESPGVNIAHVVGMLGHEVLAARHDHANQQAITIRSAITTIDRDWALLPASTVARVAANMALTMVYASQPARAETPDETPEPAFHAIHDDGVVTIRGQSYCARVDSHRGGEVKILWDQTPLTEICGRIGAFRDGTMLTPLPCSSNTRLMIKPDRISIFGPLGTSTCVSESSYRRRIGLLRRVRIILARLGIRLRRRSGWLEALSSEFSHCDRFRREILFHADAVRIRDIVSCRVACEAVVVPERFMPGGDARSADGGSGDICRAAAGGRYVEMLREFRSDGSRSGRSCRSTG
ncbi:MAG: hypothetical protein ACYTHJ_12220 [Planctomycetota bacterium]|jgi:hypothetical protein